MRVLKPSVVIVAIRPQQQVFAHGISARTQVLFYTWRHYAQRVHRVDGRPAKDERDVNTPENILKEKHPGEAWADEVTLLEHLVRNVTD